MSEPVTEPKAPNSNLSAPSRAGLAVTSGGGSTAVIAAALGLWQAGAPDSITITVCILVALLSLAAMGAQFLPRAK